MITVFQGFGEARRPSDNEEGLIRSVMGILDFSFYYIVVFLGLLTVLVFVHELGHYWVARRNGVRVEVFSIGFGPEIFGVDDSHGTRWKFSAIPLGGYVKMLGENEFGETESPDDPNARPPTEEERKESFIHKPLGARAAIVAAGPAVISFLRSLSCRFCS